MVCETLAPVTLVLGRVRYLLRQRIRESLNPDTRLIFTDKQVGRGAASAPRTHLDLFYIWI